MAIPGTAVAGATVGALLLWTGIRNVDTLPALRSIMRGEVPKGTTEGALASTPSPGVDGGSFATTPSAEGNAIADEARKYLGVPYVYGGTTRAGLDCSGLVCRVLWDLGLLPKSQRLTSFTFLTWTGAYNVPKPPVPGDLVCYGGHIAIAVSAEEMIAAPHAGAKVQQQKIYGTPAFRRVRVSQGTPGKAYPI